MRPNKTNENDCHRYEVLAVRRSEGDLLAAEELGFMDRHRRRCPVCAMSGALEDLVRYHDPQDSPIAPLDDLTKRRRVDDVVDVALRDERPVFSLRRGHRAVRTWRMSAAGIVGLAAVLVGVFLFVTRHEKDTKKAVQRPAVARLLFLSGVITGVDADGAIRSIDPHRAQRSGFSFAAGGYLHVGDGTVVITLPCAATILMTAGTVVRFDQLGRDHSTVFLEAGRLVASVTPQHKPDRLVVVTRQGRAAVKGTVFCVAKTRRRSSVSVLRGVVGVVDRAGHHSRVQSGQIIDMGGTSARRLSEADLLNLRQNLQVIGLLSQRPSRLMVRSSPQGASVVIDGVLVGRAPVLLSLRAGGHRLSVRLDGYGPVDESIDLPQRGESVRTIVLARQLSSQAVDGVPGKPNRQEVKSQAKSVHREGRQGHASASSRPLSGHRGVATDRPNALMILARSRRSARDWRGAAATYRRLLVRYPTSRLVGTARVALGEILLDHLGSAARALHQFEAYLHGRLGGMLSQEARYGKIRALRRLGRTRAERTAIEEFLARYPRALQVGFLRKRLADLKTRLGVEPNVGAHRRDGTDDHRTGGRR